MEAIRKDLIELLSDHYYSEVIEDNNNQLTNVLRIIFDSATLDQLWSIYKKVILQGMKLHPIAFYEGDYIAFSYAGQYVAMIGDGSTHT